MTRDTVTVGDKTVADVFHNHDEDHPHCVIQIGDSEIVLDGEDDYVDVEIDGWKRGDAVDLTPEDQGYHRVFRVREEGTLVATGVTYATSAVPVEIVIGGTNHIVVPNNQRVTIDLYGEPVDGEMRTDGGMAYPEPDVLDYVDAPDDTRCQMFSGAPPTECDAEADHVVVYDGDISPERTERKNILACESCWHPSDHPEIRTDGGRDAVAPTHDTPLTYQMNCGSCGELIGMSARYCSQCGTKVDHTDGNEDHVSRKLLTGGNR